MIRPSTHDRLLAFGLTTGTGCVRRSSDGSLVACLDHIEAAELAGLLGRGLSLDLALRSIAASRASARAQLRRAA